MQKHKCIYKVTTIEGVSYKNFVVVHVFLFRFRSTLILSIPVDSTYCFVPLLFVRCLKVGRWFIFAIKITLSPMQAEDCSIKYLIVTWIRFVQVVSKSQFKIICKNFNRHAQFDLSLTVWRVKLMVSGLNCSFLANFQCFGHMLKP